MTSQPRLLLIDGHSVAYRAFFALPVDNFATATGQHTNAVYGFTSMLINVLRDEEPTHVAVAFDVSRQTFRAEKYPEYKAQREKSPQEFTGQVALIKEVLDALRIPHVEVDGFEADDILATLATDAAGRGWQVQICTGDRDSLQLVDEHVTVLYPRKGVSDLARLTPAAVEEKYLVPPERYPDLAALVGESSDNLPGVPGVGPKTAAKWLARYGTLDDVLACVGEIKGKAARSLEAMVDDVRRNRELNALVRTVELPWGAEATERREWDREATHALFDALEFRVLRDRLLESLPGEDTASGDGFTIDGTLLAAGEVPAWLDAHARTGTTGMCVRGDWAAGSGDVTGIAMASGDGAAAWMDVEQLTPDDDAALAAWLADESVSKAIHGLRGPLLALWSRGWDLAGVHHDTQLSAYLLRPDQRSYDLADLSIRHLHRELRHSGSPRDTGPQDTLDFGDEEDATQRAEEAMVEASAVRDLAHALHEALQEQESDKLAVTMELPLAFTLGRMERTGIAVDVDLLEEQRSTFDGHVTRAAESAFEVIGKRVNLSSPKQLQVVLFDDLGMPRTRKTASGGHTTDAEALQGLWAKTEHPFLEHLLAHRDWIRLRQTVEGLLAAVADDGRIHTTYLQTMAATGRLSSTDPNLQNIPARTEAGRQIRRAFVAGEGWESLMTADYSQIEMRIMAHASGDEGLIEAFRSGADFHSAMAARVFDVEPGEVSSEQRARIKAMNYGLAYGLSAFGLSAQLGIDVPAAKELMEEYFERFGGVRDFLHQVVSTAGRTGYTETLCGRRRYLPDLTSSHRQRREMAERAALNAPIQGTAADIIKLAMLSIERRLVEEGLASRMLLQVHDEVVCEIAPGERKSAEAIVTSQMASALTLDVPLEVSVGVGRTWHDAAH